MPRRSGGSTSRRTPTGPTSTTAPPSSSTGTRAAPFDQLRALLPTLWADPDTGWDAWARARLATTTGAAFHTAIQVLCPEYDADELVIDPEPVGLGDSERRVWLTEQTIGGGGILHEAFQRIIERPRRFFELVAAATEPSVDEIVDSELTKFVAATLDDWS